VDIKQKVPARNDVFIHRLEMSWTFCTRWLEFMRLEFLGYVQICSYIYNYIYIIIQYVLYIYIYIIIIQYMSG